MEELTTEILQWATENTEMQTDKDDNVQYLYFDIPLSAEQLLAIYNITEK